MLHIARVAMLNANQLRKMHISEAIEELDRARDLLYDSTRFVFGIILSVLYMCTSMILYFMIVFGSGALANTVN